MKKLVKLFFNSLMIVSLTLGIMACEKDENGADTIPAVSFASSTVSIETEDGSYNLVANLSKAAPQDFTIKLQFSGTAVENEHYTVPAKEISVMQGDTEATLPITILDENIWDENLELKVTLAPQSSYVIIPDSNSEITIRFSKEVVLPVLSFELTDMPEKTNPFNAETIACNLVLDKELTAEREITLEFEGMTIGDDFLINEESSDKLTIPGDVTEYSFDLNILKKDAAGTDIDFTVALTPSDPKYLAISDENGEYTLSVSDPIVDMNTLLRTPAILGNPGFQVYQQIEETTGEWDGRGTVLNVSHNDEKKNYLKTHRNQMFYTVFDCNGNLIGGDALRLANMLEFETSDTVIADYGANTNSRYFSGSDSLIRFVAGSETTQKGTLASVNQKFSANLVLRDDWETGSNGEKQWHVDSKATGGDITKSTYPTFATIEVELVNLEGTYDLTLEEPELLFTAWFKSDSPYFMRIMPEGLKVEKEDDMYKVTYRIYPR
jgi:hypothetical protein